VQVRELAGPESRSEWNDFVAGAAVGDILQSWEWGELKARSGWRPVRLLVMEEDRPVAGISILLRRLPDLVRESLHLPACVPLPNRAIAYAPHGPVAAFDSPDAVRVVLDAASRRAKRAGAFVLKIEPAVEDPRIAAQLEGNGFCRASGGEGFGGTQPRCVMQLSLEPGQEALLAACKQKTRYNIRLAQRKGVIIRRGESVDDLRVFYDILKVTAERDRFRVRGLRYYEDMWDVLGKAGMMGLFLAEHEGKALAGAILFLFGRTCVYAYGASSNEGRQFMPNYLMQWEMICWAREHGFGVYDFRGVSPSRNPAADDHLAGLNRFKEGFGAQFVEYVGDFDRVLSPGWNALWSHWMPRIRSAMKRPQAADAPV
jgi:lipid II:glycine glycyltransferase (peptidoglycan interpeptide bridge formation enzyme)